jgi:hypothetical protein
MKLLWVNELFDWCVRLLEDMAHMLGMTYNEINVWIFCIIEPAVFLLMCWVIFRQWRKIRRLKKAFPETGSIKN